MDLVTLILWIVAGVIMFVAVGLLGMNILNKRKHQIKAEVYEIDNLGRVIPYYDRFGVIFNKTKGEKMGHLLKTNRWVGLAHENYQVIRQKKLLGTAFVKIARLIKLQDEGFAFLSPEITDMQGNEPEKIKLKVNPESVGWAVHSYLKWKGTIVAQNKFKELMSIGLMLMGLIFVLIVAVMLIKEIPHLADSLTTVSNNLATSAQSIKDSIAMQQGLIQ